MNKSDLKTGMIAVTRNGKKYVVMVGVSFPYDAYSQVDVLVAEGGWLRFDSLNEDLTACSGKLSALDIVAVYAPKIEASLWRKDISDDYYWKCIWKREEPFVEMTVAEIEEKLGIKNLKIIKEHDDE